jgi:serine/threonine-protein kinase
VGLAFAPGSLIAGRYRTERVLGQGGGGIVLAARHVELDELVAIKILKPEESQNPEVVMRFLREARAAVRIKGEHVTRVLDAASLEDGTPYMVMEHLEGTDLGALLEQSGSLPLGTAVDYILQACEALAEAHALGIVHRDVKPSNLFLTHRSDGTPSIKVLDFGIAKAIHPVDASRPDLGLTQTQTVMGSPQYMAPEQMRSSRRVDERVDVWGLGMVLYELLTGEPAFSAVSVPELFAMILQDPTPPLRERRPDAPPGLDAIVARCLAKDPGDRPSSVHELAALLGPFATPDSAGIVERIARVAHHVATVSSPKISVPKVPASSSKDVELAHARTADGSPRSTRPLAGYVVPIASAAVLGVVLLLGVVVIATRPAPRPDVAAAAASAAPPAAASAGPAPSKESDAPALALPPPPAALDEAAPTSSVVGAPVHPRPSAVRRAPSPSTSEAPRPPPPAIASPPTEAPPAPAPHPSATPTATSRYD